MKVSQRKLPKSMVEIEAELTSEEFKGFVEKATLNACQKAEFKGFRKGTAPKEMVEEKVGKENLLIDAADLAIKETYPKIILEQKLEPISQPNVDIIKLAIGSPFIFKVKIAVLPDIKLPDYKKIASKVETKQVFVEEKEIDDSLVFLQKSQAKFFTLQKPAEYKDFIEIEYESKDINQGKEMKDSFVLGEGGFVAGFEEKLVGMKIGEEKEFSLIFSKNYNRKDLAGKEVNFKVKLLNVQKVELPEINDDFAKSLGNFNDLGSLKNNIKEGLKAEKEIVEKERKRKEILEKINKESKFEIPEILVNAEKERLLKDLKERINQNLKISFESYLTSTNQTAETLKDSFLKESEKKIKNFLILREIGQRENIFVSEEEVEEEISKTIKNYPKGQIEKIDIAGLKEYTKEVIYNKKVFEKLESFSI